MTEEEEVKYKSIATTEDTNDPVMRVIKGNSKMDVIIDRRGEALNVWSVKSEKPGDMKAMLDDFVSKVKYNWVQFVAPLEEDDKEEADAVFEAVGAPDDMKFSTGDNDRNIRDVLDGFQEVTEEHKGKEVPLLVGFWEVDE